MQFKVMPTPQNLHEYVESITIAQHSGDARLSINVCLNGLPGIVFQHHDGQSPIDHIATSSGLAAHIPTLFVYGQMTEPGVMHYQHVPFTTIQIVLKPHALQTLLGIHASALTNSTVDLAEFSARNLNTRLLEAPTEPERLTLLTDFLATRLRQAPARDCLVEASLRLIHANVGGISVKYLLQTLSISERQFEKRFRQTVGLSPQFYLRVKRFNAALRLMKTRQFAKLTDLAHALNYYDQSHFIRDFKAFSGITPKNLFQKVDAFQPGQKVFAYL